MIGEYETVAVADLKDHPRNYRQHPDDQIEHLMQSIRENGVYRNIVVARDNTVLAGHGVLIALRRMGIEEVDVRRLDLDPLEPRAMKVLTGDNEISHLGVIDDRMLTEILKDIHDQSESGLEGTGFDEGMLANLLFITRPATEIQSKDEAAEWVGMPEYEPGKRLIRFLVLFEDDAAIGDFAERLGINLSIKPGVWASSIWWPPKEIEDPSSLRFEGPES